MLCAWAAGHGARSVLSVLGTHAGRVQHRHDEERLMEQGVGSIGLLQNT